MAAGTTPQQKHVLHHLVKKVLVHDRRTVEVWYGLPNPPSVSRPGKLAPQMSRSTNRRASVAEPEVWVRIVHIIVDSPNTAYRQQTVEIAIGPKRAFALRGASGLDSGIWLGRAPAHKVAGCRARRRVGRFGRAA